MAAPDPAARAADTPAHPVEDAADAAPSATVPALPRLVGIGASAGGVEALRALVQALPAGAIAAYVVAQHTAPDYRSTLAALLAATTALEVVDLADGTVPLAGTVYIAPASHDVVLAGGRLRLVAPHGARAPHPSVDRLLHALAAEMGPRAIGIVLSGTGADGATGLRAIKAAGGVALVQDPGSARHAGMPRAAIQAGGVDLVLTPAEMGPALARLFGQGGLAAAMEVVAIAEAPAEIARLVRVSTGFRLNDYKPSTVQRRIARRMGLLGIDRSEDYIARIRGDRGEAEALVRDTFISVTTFFRDEQAFAALRPAIARLVAAAAGTRVLRCWVPACATGEEAWSLAMLFEDALADGDGEYIVFATDVDEQALETGRRGIYPLSAIEAIPEPLRARHVEATQGPGGGAAGAIRLRRGRVVFARQNVLEDPPFAHLDLVSCRNLLIYLNPRVQQQLLRAFHFALRPEGVLFLGRAENADAEDKLFAVADAAARIYLRGEGPASLALAGQPGLKPRTGAGRLAIHERAAQELPVATRATEVLARRHAPATVVIDEHDRIVHLHGDLGPFLRFPQAPGEWNLFDLLRAGPRAELRALTGRCRREGGEATTSAWPLTLAGEERLVTPAIARLDPTRADLLTIAFVLAPADPVAAVPVVRAQDDNMLLHELENELTRTRGHLHAMVEALETSNEELQALNEMLQATNEELQTSNEELQTSNEELLTVNEELQGKSGELETAVTDLDNIRESLSFPLIVVDGLMRLTSANRASRTIADPATLTPGRPLGTIGWRIPVVGLVDAIGEVVRDGEPLSHLIRSDDGRSHNLTVMPYYATPGVIGGALLLFEDVTEREAALAARDEIESHFRDAMHSAPNGMCIRRLDGVAVTVNPQMRAMLGMDEAEISAQGWKTFYQEEDLERLDAGRRDLLEGRIDRFAAELRVTRSDGSTFWTAVSASLVRGADGKATGTITQIQDIDRARQDRVRLEDLAEKMRLATENGRIGIWERKRDDGALFWDAGMRELYGLPADHGPVTVAWWESRIVPEDRARVLAAFAATLGEGVPLEVEYRIHQVEGEVRHVVARARLLDSTRDRLVGTSIDVTELRVLSERLAGENRALAIAMRENQARAEENRLLIEASAHGVIAVDPQGCIRSVNGAAELLFGHAEAALLGRPIEVLVPDGQRMGHVMMRSDVELPERSVHQMARGREVLGLHADGSEIPIDVQLRRAASTSEPGVVASIVDLRPRLAQERAMAQARDAAEAANRAKSNFIATMSHEIRTPMNVVFGMLELLGRGDLGEQQRDYIRKAQFATRSLRQLIDDILDFSRIEARRLTLESEPFSLNDLINAVAEQIAGTMTEGKRGLELVVDLDPGLPATVIGDALRLQQVLLNLGSNAVKFTPRGRVTLGVRIIHRLATGKVGLEFAVADTGIGIGADKLSAIFESFTQAEASTTRRFGGSGLGLSISQRLVQLMGGTIVVHSEEGQGSRFAFTVALGVPRVDPAVPAADEAGPATVGLRVLIVDDDERSRDILADMARALGWQVETAGLGEVALAQIEAGAGFDIVLVDWWMPGLDGWQVAEAIRARGHREGGEQRPTLVALLAASDMAEFRARAVRQASPFDSQLSKPATLAVLQRMATGVVRERAKTQPDLAPTPARSDRLAGLRILVAEDFVLNQELLRSLLEAEGATVAIAGDGLRAVEAVLAEGAVFDVVLMDVQMPEMDGFEATQALRRCGDDGNLPILAITANAQRSDRERCLAVGMDDYLAKPIAIEDLVAKVRRLADMPRDLLPHRMRGAAAPPSPPAGREVSLPADRELIDALTFDHAAQVLARGAGEGMKGHVEVLATLIATIEAAVAAGDVQRVRAASQTLVGAAGGLGAMPLTALARRVAREGERAEMPADAAAMLEVARASVAALRARLD